MILPPQSEKILRLALNSAASEGEWQAAAVKFIGSLRLENTAPEDIIEACQRPPARSAPPYFMPFGQYKGLPLSRIPTEYLLWIVAKIDNKPDLVRAAELELEARA